MKVGSVEGIDIIDNIDAMENIANTRNSLSNLGQKMPSQFNYDSLPTPESIRLVHLYKEGNKICGKIQQAQLPEVPVYSAVSYVWQYKSGTKPFYLDGQQVQITTNLADFIERVLDGSSAPLYWIDAICINQSDDAEKSAQVWMMRRIYESASKVLIWLGEDDETSRQNIDFMAKCHDSFKRAGKAYGSNDSTAWPSHWPEMLGMRLANGRVPDRESWEGLARFFRERQWWDRIWTVQEYISPVSKSFICGDELLRPSWIISTMRLLAALRLEQDFEFLEGMGCSRPDGTELFVRNYKRGRGVTVFTVLCGLRFYLASDPRDKVFAPLGLVPADQRAHPCLTVDYSLKPANLFTNLAEYFLEKDGNLDWLEAATGTMVENCPSWVPDWSYSSVKIRVFPKQQFNKSGEAVPLYSPWGEGIAMDWNQRPQIIKTLQGATLHLTGVFLDEVDKRRRMVRSNYEISTFQSWAEKTCRGRNIYPQTGESMLQAVLTTMAVDLRWGKKNPYPFKFVRGAGTPNIAPGMSIKEIVQSWMFTSSRDPELQDLCWSRRNITDQRSLIETNRGFVGLGTPDSELGDKIFAFAGGRMLYVVRSIPGTTDRYRFVDECYLHGLMDGEWRTGDGFGKPRRIILE